MNVMTVQKKRLKIRRPDDWHVHFRDDNMLRTVVPYTSRYFGRAIIMPNLTPPITTLGQAIGYRERILASVPPGHRFIPLMTCYLTDFVDKETLITGHRLGIFTAAKLYLASATTHSSHGVMNITAIYPLFSVMQDIGMPLLIHGEVTAADIDIFDREACFIEQVLDPIRQHFPSLKIVFEHITTKEATDYVLAGDRYLCATITPQHLMFNRNHMLVGNVRPHLYCFPILKRNVHQQALRSAVASGCDRLFLGTDTAPHTRQNKESDCGGAGVFNAPVALQAYATVFEEIGALAHFEAFCSLNGPRFYELSINEEVIELRREETYAPASISLVEEEDEVLVPFLARETLKWTVVDDSNHDESE